MAILFDSGVGSSISDSVRLVSMPTTRSSAVLRYRVRIDGDWKFANLLCCEQRAEMRWDKKQQQCIGSTTHQSSRMAWPRICNSLNISFFVFLTQASYLTWAWSWAVTWAISCFFSETLHCPAYRSIPRSFQRWVSIKSSISQLKFFILFYDILSSRVVFNDYFSVDGDTKYIYSYHVLAGFGLVVYFLDSGRRNKLNQTQNTPQIQKIREINN